MVRKALTASQKKAVSSKAAATVLVESLNEKVALQQIEINGLRANYADTQNKLERMHEKYNKADALTKILDSKSDALVAIEFIKTVLFGVLLAWGFLLIGQKNNIGIWLVAAGILVYLIGVWLQKKTASTKKRIK